MRPTLVALILGLSGAAAAQTPPQKPVTKTSADGTTETAKPAPKGTRRPARRRTPQQAQANEIQVGIDGEYGGVSSEQGAESQPAKPAGPRKHRPHTVSWVGFQLVGSGAPRVFLQTTSTPTYTQAVTAGKDELLVKVPGFSLETHNDTRPLETQYFRTDVLEVAAKNAGGGVEVRVRFRKGTAREGAAHVSDENGTSMLVFDFGGAQTPG